MQMMAPFVLIHCLLEENMLVGRGFVAKVLLK